MVSPSSLLIEKPGLLMERPGSEQVVRRPCRTDAIGALLQRVYAVRRAVPNRITQLLTAIDTIGEDRDRRFTDRRLAGPPCS